MVETYSSLFVCLMGLVTVFFGLICIILLTKLMSRCCQVDRNRDPITSATIHTQIAPNQQEIIAAIFAAISEEIDADIGSTHITSVKQL